MNYLHFLCGRIFQSHGCDGQKVVHILCSLPWNTSYQVEGKGFGFWKYLLARIHCTCWVWNQLRICVNWKEKKFLTRLARALWSQGWLKLWCQLNMQWKYLAIETPKVIQNKFFILCVFVLFFLWIWLKLVLIFMPCGCDHSGQEIKHCALHHIISKEVLGDHAHTYTEALIRNKRASKSARYFCCFIL